MCDENIKQNNKELRWGDKTCADEDVNNVDVFAAGGDADGRSAVVVRSVDVRSWKKKTTKKKKTKTKTKTTTKKKTKTTKKKHKKKPKQK